MTPLFPHRRAGRQPLAFLAASAVLTCALAPAAHADDGGDAKPRCTYVDVADLPIRYAGLGLMPAVDGTIDGAPATMLADTGAFDTQLTMNGAARHGLFTSSTGRYVEGFGGLSRLYTSRLKQFAIGPIEAKRHVTMYVIGEDNLTPAYDAIVGAPFLLQTDLEFDLRAKTMRFFRQRDCGKTDLLLWQEATVIVPFEYNRSSSPNPHFTVVIDGKELDAIIDTGAHSTLMTLGAARHIGIDVKAPGVKRMGDVVGIGSERAPHWIAHVNTVQIGDEKINGADIGIVDSQGSDAADLYLGQDFLRAHRVLFAMSQKRLYIAYLGGTVFATSGALPDWIRAEADGGNADAAYVLAQAYRSGRGLPRDPAQAAAWLQKAAAAGQPNANLAVGRQQMLAKQYAEAIPKLRGALDQLPADRIGPLWLYIARVRVGDAELAKKELQGIVDKQDKDDWPEPVAEFYLGKLDASHVFERAAKDRNFAQARTCMADAYLAEWYAAQGQQEQADALLATRRAQCAPAPRPAPVQNATP